MAARRALAPAFAFRAGLTRNTGLLVYFITTTLLPASDRTEWRNPAGAMICIGIWILLAAAWAFRHGRRWREILRLRNGLAPDGGPLTRHEAGQYYAPAAVPNGWVLPGLVAGAVVMLGAAVSGYPAIGSSGHGLAVLWLFVAAAVAAWFRGLDRWARRRMAPSPPISPAVVEPPTAGWSLRTAASVVVGSGVAWLVAVSIGTIAGVLGIGMPMRWILAASAVLVAVRCAMAERRLSQTIGLWDVLPRTGPQPILGQQALPPPPDQPGRPAAG